VGSNKIESSLHYNINIHLNSNFMDPNNRCRNITCNLPVHISNVGKHYYCLDHMNCGNSTNGKPCKGCMSIIQGSMKDMTNKFRKTNPTPNNTNTNNTNNLNNFSKDSEIVIEIAI